MYRILLSFPSILVVVSPAVAFAADTTPDYATHIAPIFRKYCVGCHNATDKEGKLNLQTYAGLLKGGENGKVLVPKDLKKSRLVGVIDGTAKPVMPPEGSKGPTKAEIALLKAWVKAGAMKPKGVSPNDTLVVPKIKPRAKVRRAVHAIVAKPAGRIPQDAWVAVARHGVVEILDATSHKPLRKLNDLQTAVADLAVSRDGQLLAAAGGESGVRGDAVVWNTKTWKPVARLNGHADSLYAIAISPDGKQVATGGYDRVIKLWDIATGKPIRDFKGHNGPIHDLAFHPSGKLLASASGDRTVKLWDVATGKRLDTLGQPEKDQYAVAFTPDGNRIVAGGVDNRIRVWAVKAGGKEGTNPLLYARFSHESAILRLVFSPDGKRLVSSSEDHTIKLWETGEYTQLRSIKKQSDWVTGLAVSPNGKTLHVGRLDGSLARITLGTKAKQVADVEPIRLAPVPKSGSSGNAVAVKEKEPNNDPKSAQRIALPANVSGVFQRDGDFDVYRIQAKAGQDWILETNAARSKSPADTKIEILHPDGRPVLRYLLRAVRDSFIEFRPIDSRQTQVRVKNWEEMQLNQYLYMGGEVCKLFLAPRGPDSGFNFYSNRGKRRTYFDTSSTVHAKLDPVYIVEAYPAGTQLVDNGLPVFPLYFQNDDDGERELGNDSRLTFTAPKDGEYLIRVSDTQGHGSAKHKYTLTIRQPKPDFKVSLAGGKATIPQGSGKRLTVNVDRIDGFTGEIRIDISGLPQGFTATTPIIVQADHLTARGVINVARNVAPTVMPKAKKKGKAKQPRDGKPASASKKIDWSKVKVTATAMIHGKKVVKPVAGLGPIQVAKRPKVIVHLEFDPEAKMKNGELIIRPGETITAMLRIERFGFKGELKFDVDHLPHGVIVDNIGLSGILIRNNENRRRIYFTAADWVPDTTRKIHAVAKGQGNQASRPIRFRVRGAKPQAAAGKR